MVQKILFFLIPLRIQNHFKLQFTVCAKVRGPYELSTILLKAKEQQKLSVLYFGV
jgi:hypothetical protein